MELRLTRAVVACVLGFVALRSHPAAAQTRRTSALSCFRLRYERDSLESWLPTVARLAPASNPRHFWWNLDSLDGREMEKQLRGRAQLRSLPADSVRLTTSPDFVMSVELRGVVVRDTLRGIVRWWWDAQPQPDWRRQFLGIRSACPDRAPAS